MRNAVERFGRGRAEQGDLFRAEQVRGYWAYSYTYAGTQVLITVWGDDAKPTISVCGCARYGLTPELELYRYISRWRTSVPLAAPYVVEMDGAAAVMTEREILSGLVSSDTLAINVAIVVDLLQETTRALADDLTRADGYRLEQQSNGSAGSVAATLIRLWETSDSRVSSLIGLAPS